MHKKVISVLGAGSWGSALAYHLAQATKNENSHQNGYEVWLWGHDSLKLKDIEKAQENKAYLSGVKVPNNLIFESSLERVAKASHAILLVTPSFSVGEMMAQLKAFGFDKLEHFAWATKGFLKVDKAETLEELFFSNFFDRVLDKSISKTFLTGPSFATEVGRGLPTALVSVSESDVGMNFWVKLLHHYNIRMYGSCDIVGAQLGAAYKNIIAITTGISDGLGFGSNARAALITRGLNEMRNLYQKLKQDAHSPELTIFGLAGLGDLVLTATDKQSRNYSFGFNLVKKQMQTKLVEGIYAAEIIYPFIIKKDLDLPLLNAVYQIVINNLAVKDVVEDLMSREPKKDGFVLS